MGRRFLHGMFWGAVATVCMGIVTLAAIALHVWPAEAPLSVMLGRLVFGAQMPLWQLAIAVGAVHLAYGMFCGGLLALLSWPVTYASALGLGFLRWIGTQIISLPALGWGEFAWGAHFALAVATAFPHLAYALVLGKFMVRDDRRLAGSRRRLQVV